MSWWHLGSKGINSNGIDLVCLEYSGLTIRRAKWASMEDNHRLLWRNLQTRKMFSLLTEIYLEETWKHNSWFNERLYYITSCAMTSLIVLVQGLINSLAPGICDNDFKNYNLQTHYTEQKLGYSLQNCSQVNATEHHQWEVNIGSGNGLSLNRRQAMTWTNVDRPLLHHTPVQQPLMIMMHTTDNETYFTKYYVTDLRYFWDTLWWFFFCRST